MTKPSHWVSELARVALPLAFVSLVAAAVAGIASPLFFAMVLSAGLVIVVIRALFPAGRLFPIAFASLIAVYAAIFSLFVEEIFPGIDSEFLIVGFCLPIFFFVVGCWLRRDQVRAVVAHPAIRSERRVMTAAIWLLPVFLVGAAVILLSRTVGTLANMDMVFLGAMSIIGLIVLTVSRDVAIFLVDAGLLFEEFFSRVSRLVIPAFAFVTFYSLIVILFASAYRLISVSNRISRWGALPALDLFGVNLFLDRYHQHRRLRGHYSVQQPRPCSGLPRGLLRHHAVVIRCVGTARVRERTSPRSA
jgi:voltage-gated potassium channel